MKVIPETCAPNLISTFLLDLPHFSEMPASNQKYEQSCICELGVSSLPVSMIFYWDFAIVPTMVFFSFILQHEQSVNKLFRPLDVYLYVKK
jgi:hypothetical protein